ncbi:MAG TPA: hypothetical protein VNQ81_14935 [Povalibacter sp.]|nr:hypothetical protein [Povalibacter sp.]
MALAQAHRRSFTKAAQSADLALWPTKVLVFMPVVMATVLSKFSPPLGGAMPGLSMVLPVCFAAVVVGVLSSRMQLASNRLAWFLAMLSVLGLIQVWRGDMFSLTSVLMMGVLGLSYVPVAREGVTSADAVRFFCNLSVLIALLGILQFLLQFAVGRDAAFPIETWVPEAFRTHGYNNMTPLYWGSPIYKANGIVMVEPSTFSQLCALGLIAELSSRERLWRLLAYAGALVVSYSGTGLLILAVTLPLFVIIYARWDLLIKGLLLFAVLAIFSEPLHLQVILNRAGEFNSSGSSAFERFVGWQNLFAEKLWTSPSRALLGYGAGSYFEAASGYDAGEMAHAKIIFEFGVVGALLYFGFVFYCLFRSTAPLILRIAVGVAYFMNGAYSPTVTGVATSLLLWPVQEPVTKPQRVGWLEMLFGRREVRHAA